MYFGLNRSLTKRNIYMKKLYLFALGADDPEMWRIEEILIEHGYTYLFATHKGQRVHPQSAYQADTPLGINLDNYTLVCVECELCNSTREASLGYDNIVGFSLSTIPYTLISTVY